MAVSRRKEPGEKHDRTEETIQRRTQSEGGLGSDQGAQDGQRNRLRIRGASDPDRAMEKASPEIFNSDQGVQFTSTEITNRLKAADIRISWDGRGRALDNIFVERLWRSVKYEEV